MTFTCTDLACECVEHVRDPWDHGMYPACPFCRSALYDQLDKPLEPGADKGWCLAKHWNHGIATIAHSYRYQSWDWRPMTDFPGLAPLAEVAEMAANAEPAEPDLEQR